MHRPWEDGPTPAGPWTRTDTLVGIAYGGLLLGMLFGAVLQWVGLS